MGGEGGDAGTSGVAMEARREGVIGDRRAF